MKTEGEILNLKIQLQEALNCLIDENSSLNDKINRNNDDIKDLKGQLYALEWVYPTPVIQAKPDKQITNRLSKEEEFGHGKPLDS